MRTSHMVVGPMILLPLVTRTTTAFLFAELPPSFAQCGRPRTTTIPSSTWLATSVTNRNAPRKSVDAEVQTAPSILLGWRLGVVASCFAVVLSRSTSAVAEPVSVQSPPSLVVTSSASPFWMVASSNSDGSSSISSGSSVLFQTNPLTNGILEQLRIWNQAEADNIRYGGELERGDAGNRGQVSAYPKLLVPILRMSRDVDVIVTTLQQRSVPKVDGDGDSSSAAAIIEIYATLERRLQQPVYDVIAFKRTFNAFADNIYYSDPDRANLYLGGGALPKTEQSLAYLLRNEILGALQDLRAELAYLQTNSNDTEAQDDARRYANQARDALQRYLQIVSPAELRVAQELLLQSEGETLPIQQ